MAARYYYNLHIYLRSGGCKISIYDGGERIDELDVIELLKYVKELKRKENEKEGNNGK